MEPKLLLTSLLAGERFISKKSTQAANKSCLCGLFLYLVLLNVNYQLFFLKKEFFCVEKE